MKQKWSKFIWRNCVIIFLLYFSLDFNHFSVKFFILVCDQVKLMMITRFLFSLLTCFSLHISTKKKKQHIQSPSNAPLLEKIIDFGVAFLHRLFIPILNWFCCFVCTFRLLSKFYKLKSKRKLSTLSIDVSVHRIVGLSISMCRFQSNICSFVRHKLKQKAEKMFFIFIEKQTRRRKVKKTKEIRCVKLVFLCSFVVKWKFVFGLEIVQLTLRQIKKMNRTNCLLFSSSFFLYRLWWIIRFTVIIQWQIQRQTAN